METLSMWNLSPDDRYPWERRDDESGPAWLAFKAYRDMGPARSQAKLMAQGFPGTVADWSRKYFWVHRAQQYDHHGERLRLQSQSDAVEEARALLVDHVMELMKELIAIALGEKEATPGQVAALNSALDRAGLKPVEKVELQERKVFASLLITDEQYEDYLEQMHGGAADPATGPMAEA
ncbi:MAG: hypothetical protein AAF970_11155 [Bacteroidota bacterium]